MTPTRLAGSLRAAACAKAPGSSQQGLNGFNPFVRWMIALLWVNARIGFETFHIQIPWSP